MKNSFFLIFFILLFSTSTTHAENGSITADELKIELDRNKAIVVDVGERNNYQRRNFIPNSIYIPIRKIDAKLNFLKSIKDKQIVFVNRNGNTALDTYKYCQKVGFTNINYLKYGIIGWMQKKYPTVKNPSQTP